MTTVTGLRPPPRFVNGRLGAPYNFIHFCINLREGIQAAPATGAIGDRALRIKIKGEYNAHVNFHAHG